MTLAPPRVLAGAEVLTLEQLYRDHRDRVYVWALRFVGGRAALAEDLTQDVFFTAHRRLADLRPGDVGGWLYRVTATLALKRVARERSLLHVATAWVRGASLPAAPDHLVEAKDSAEKAWQNLLALEGPERIVVSMKVIDGLSQVEIADALALSKGYVSKLLARGWAALRAAGWELSDDE